VHEWALAEAVLESVRQATPAGARVTAVTLRLGELQAVDTELLLGGLRELAPAYGIAGGSFSTDVEAAAFACVPCGVRWTLAELAALDPDVREAVHFLPEACHSYLRCPSCGSRDFAVLSGRGVTIAAIEAESAGAGPASASGGAA
jgi:hydrogenase nickel incorporation protein HypA/HybF